jgi:hypothetical protein
VDGNIRDGSTPFSRIESPRKAGVWTCPASVDKVSVKPGLAQMPRELWTWDVDVEVADLSTAERLSAMGLPPPTPGRRSWQTFQKVGEQLRADGWPGLLAPSAALPAGKVLCLFRDKAGVRGAEPASSPRRVSEPPPPPTGLRT